MKKKNKTKQNKTKQNKKKQDKTKKFNYRTTLSTLKSIPLD